MAIKHRGIYRSSSEMTVDEFKVWLKQFDKDGDGRICRNELRTAIRSLGKWFSSWKSGRGVREADSDGNGYIDDDEIENLVSFAENSLGFKVVTY